MLVGELALAGTRALWVDYDAGTHRYCHLMTATTARPRPTELPECEHADPDRELHGLAGDGTMLAFNSWYDCTAPGQACSPGLRIHSVELWRVYRGRLKELGGIWSASPTVASVDAGRILLGPNPIVGLDASGKRLWSWFFHGLSARAVKLQGSQVAATIPCGIGSPGACGVIAYGTKTRTSGSVWRVPRDASLRDLQNGIAVYLAGGVAHVVRMSDGTDRAFHAAGGRPIADAELERPGLFYSYNATGGAKPGRIAFVPFADLMR